MKMTISQRILALALAICLVLSMIPGMDLIPEVKATANQWTKIAGSGQISADANTPFNASLQNYATAYYDQKIDVVEGTKISFKVNFANISSSTALVQYAFSLVNKAGSFYTSDNVASSMSVEMTSTAATAALNATASKKLAGGDRAWLANVASLASPRNTTDVYTVTFEKINVTESDVNYSWKLTLVKNGTTTYTCRYKAADIAHDMFKDGAYLAVGSMSGGTTHTVALSNLVVIQPGDTTNWKAVTTTGGIIDPESGSTFNATLDSYVTAYYDQKIDVVDGTKISYKVQFPTITNKLLLQYAFSLVNRAGSFHTSDTVAGSMSLELISTVNNGVAGALNAIASKKLAGSSSRTWLANVASVANPRSNADVYTVTLEKINVTESDVNYSWMLTLVKNGTTTYTYRYKATDIPHNMFANGAYLAVGSMAGSTTHAVKISDLSVTVDIPEDPAGWNAVTGTANNLTPESDGTFNAAFAGSTTGYYNDKIDVEDGTTISFKTKLSAINDEAAAWYGYSLVNDTRSFHETGDADALTVELQSLETPWAVKAEISRKVAGGADRELVAALPNALSDARDTTAVYTVTYQKIRRTVENVEYSWLITVNNGTAAQEYLVPAAKIPHDTFKDGLYIAAGSMNDATGHTMQISDLSVKVVDLEGWNTVAGSKENLTATGADATLSNYVTAYYNNKLTVEDGTAISFKVNFPTLADGTTLHYGFSLVDTAKSFYTSNTTANSLSVELQSTASGSNWPMRGIVSKKLAGSASRTFMANIPTALATNRNTTDTYTIKLQKISGLVAGVEYSWKISVTNSTGTQEHLVAASDISNVLFADGVYLAAGCMTSASGHTVTISDLTVAKEEYNLQDPEGWNIVSGSKDNLTVDAQQEQNATIEGNTTAYYNNKITVEDGTAISFQVKFPTMAAAEGLHYGFSLMSAPKSFYQTGSANALSVEIQSNTQVEDKWPVRAVVTKKVSGGANRVWLANIPNALLTDRDTDEVYTIKLQKISGEVDGVEYSWKITVTNGDQDQIYLMPAETIAHDLFADGVYLAAGSMTSATGHTVQITGLTVAKEAYSLQDPAGWNAIAGNGLTADGANATLKNYTTAYYNNKIAVQEGTTISFQVSMPTMAAGEGLHYGFSLVDKAKSFYNSDTVANSLSVELQSLREVNEKWPVYAVISQKNTGGSRVWMANLGSGMSADRDTKATYTVTFRKIDETVNNINYSWYVTVTCGNVSASYAVKASDVPHDRYAGGAYLAAGAMTSVSNHTVKIANTSVKLATDAFDTDKLVDLSGIWKVIRGYGGTTGKGLSYKSGTVTMEGYGGTAYMKESVKSAVSVEFTLNKYDIEKGDFFSFGLVNKQGVYYKPDGTESQGIYVRIKEVSEKLSVVIYTVDEDGSVAIGELTSTTKAKGVKHYVTFFKEGGTWYAALDGKQKLRIDETVELEDISYLVAGANTNPEQSMTVNKVSVDSAVTSAMKAGTLKAGYKVNGFQIVRGYGVGNPATGTGLVNKSGSTQMQGYGGITYTGGKIKNAVAVDFELDAFSGTSYFFSFGLVNKEGVYYNPNGKESQGVYVRIKSWANGNGMNVTVFNLTEAGSEELGTIVTNIPPTGQKHNLSIFKEDGVWYVGIDGFQKMQLNVDVVLGKASYLVAGASATADLTMTVHDVYIDGKVSDEMKSGSLVMSATANSQAGDGDSTGGTSTEKTEGDSFNTQEGTDGPGNVVEKTGNGQTVLWIVIGVLVCAAIVALYFLFLAKKDKKEEK